MRMEENRTKSKIQSRTHFVEIIKLSHLANRFGVTHLVALNSVEYINKEQQQ